MDESEPVEDLEAVATPDLRARVRDYLKVIEELRSEVRKAQSQSLANVSKVRVYTDSLGICLAKFSAQCAGDLPGDWHDFEHVEVQCLNDITAKDSDFDIELDADAPSFFSKVVEEVHKAKGAADTGLKEIHSLKTLGLMDVVSTDDSVAIDRLPTDSASTDLSTITDRADIPETLVALSAEASIVSRLPILASVKGLTSTGMDEAVDFLDELDKKDSEMDAKKEEVTSEETSLIGAWFGDLPEYTRGQTMYVMRGITSTSDLRAADFYVNLRRRFDDSRPIRVLSLDGGGLRTALTAQLVREIEKGAGGVPLCKCFDLIVGTSAGGMFALELAKLGWKVQQCDDWVDSLGLAHFAAKPSGIEIAAKFLSDSSLTDTEAFRKTINDVFTHWGTTEDPPMKGRPDGHCSHVAVTSVRSDIVPWRPFIFRSYNFGRELGTYEGTDASTVCEAVHATTSAPVVMDLFKMQMKRLYKAGASLLGKTIEDDAKAEFMDGGVYQNNPSLTALFEAKQLFGYSRDVLLVSVGTGHLPKQYNQHQASGWFGKIGTLGLGLFEAKEVANLQLLRQLVVEGENYFRFDMAVESEECDKSSMIPYFRKRAHAWLRKNDNEKAKLQALGRFVSRYAEDPLPEEFEQE